MVEDAMSSGSLGGSLIEDAIGFGWRTFTQRIGFFIKLALVSLAIIAVPFVLYFATFMLAMPKSETSSPNPVGMMLAMLFLFVGIVAEFVVMLGWARISLHLVDGGVADLGDLFPDPMQVISFLISGLIMSIAVSIGFVLLVIPGIFLYVRLGFYWLAAADGAGPIEALQRSWALTDGSFWKVLIFLIVAWLILAVGQLALLIGLVAAAPVVSLAYAHIYRRLPANAPAAQPAFAS
jgi:uncharacterized membrane protein